MRRRIWLLSLVVLAAPAGWAEPSAPPPGYRPPETRELCPALAEDYDLCSDDLQSGNCADLVAAVGRLGDIYRSEARAHPGWIDALQTTIWWGCGTASLEELRSALEVIDSPQAREILALEPFRSMGEPRAPAAAPPPPENLDCEAPATQSARDACAARELARARQEHERALAACRERVAPALRRELVDAEASWEKELPLECSGAAALRDPCLANAYRERTQAMRSLHPECAAPGS